MTRPIQAVLDHFGVTVTTELGGRLNKHWQVKRRGEELLRRSPLMHEAPYRAG